MKKILVVFIFCISLFGCCGNREVPELPVSPSVVPTISPAQASSVEPTATPMPTATPIPTETPAPTKDETPKSSLELLREEIAEAGALCGVAFLGYFEGEYTEITKVWEKAGIYETYPLLAEVIEEQVILSGGGEWFLLVPVDESVIVWVDESYLDETDFMLKPGKELYGSMGGNPILICGNASDIFPSTVVMIKKDDYNISYSPCLSLKDGSVAEGEGIYVIE